MQGEANDHQCQQCKELLAEVERLRELVSNLAKDRNKARADTDRWRGIQRAA